MTANFAYIEANATYQSQWSGVDGGPEQLSAGVQVPFTSMNMGLGLQIKQDKIGPLSQTAVQLNYAYHIPTGRSSRLSFGLSGEFGQYRLDPSREITASPNDPLLFSEAMNTSYYNLGAGVYFYSTDMEDWEESYFFAGLSAYQAIPQDLIFGTNTNLPRDLHAYALLGYRFYFDQFFLEPSAQLDYAMDDILLPRFQVLLEMIDSFWAGLAIDGAFSTSIQAGFILDTGGYNYVRVGAYAGTNISPQGLNLGTSYGVIAAYRID